MIDNILVCGGKNVFDKVLNWPLQHCQEVNLRLNLKNRRVSRPEVCCLGLSLTKNGLAVHQRRINDILKVPKPQRQNKLQTFHSTTSFQDCLAVGLHFESCSKRMLCGCEQANNRDVKSTPHHRGPGGTRLSKGGITRTQTTECFVVAQLVNYSRLCVIQSSRGLQKEFELG